MHLRITTVWFALGLILLCGCRRTTSVVPSQEQAHYVGSQRCAECHGVQTEKWMESHHHKAMQLPTAKTVRGDFSDTEFDYFGIKTRFFRRGEDYWVTTDGPEGVTQSYKVEYTFGFEPLQQYLVKFPDGRLRALSICWDTQNKKWFHLHPDEKIDSSDSLHWTGSQYNWNFMCAECHSTDVRKNYDLESDSYSTTYREVNVACESCHGPGSRHLDSVAGEELPRHGFLSDLRGRGPWKPQTSNHPPLPGHPDRKTDQLDTCARCHSRRASLKEPYPHGESLEQSHSLSLLSEGLYHSDGQIDDEVYVYGSFLQSKMYHAGVVCTDCHDPHTARLKLKGDALCLSCHLQTEYKTEAHSHHQGVSCVECHMPGKHYMGIDYRRDHSFRIPRPDLSAETGAPNACNQCHQDKSTQWSREAFLRWYGEPPKHYGSAFHKLQGGDQSALPEVASLALDKSYPEIVRATAVSLAPLPEVVTQALKDESHLVRREGVRALLGAPLELRMQLLQPLASDASREVRIEVGRLLADSGSNEPEIEKAVGEYQSMLDYNSDRVESRLGMADLLLSQGKPAEAEKEFEAILKRYPNSVQAYVNAADFFRVIGQDEKGRKILEQGLTRVETPAPLHHALGLLLVRKWDYQQGLEQLELAFLESPQDAQYALVYAVGLESQGQTAKAVEILEAATKKRPRDTQLLDLLKSYRANL